MTTPARKRPHREREPVRVLGRGLRVERGVRLSLKSVREAAGKTQIDVAEASQIDQSDVSRLEARADLDDCQVATLRRYVAALGGRLELVARFGDRKIVLAGAPVGGAAPRVEGALPHSKRTPRRRGG